MSRDEALVAVLNAARALKAQWPLGDYLPGQMQPVLTQLYAAIDAVDAVGDATVTTTALFWCAHPECWRQNDTAGMYCYQHSAQAALPSLRRRDAALEVQDD